MSLQVKHSSLKITNKSNGGDDKTKSSQPEPHPENAVVCGKVPTGAGGFCRWELPTSVGFICTPQHRLWCLLLLISRIFFFLVVRVKNYFSWSMTANLLNLSGVQHKAKNIKANESCPLPYRVHFSAQDRLNHLALLTMVLNGLLSNCF